MSFWLKEREVQLFILQLSGRCLFFVIICYEYYATKPFWTSLAFLHYHMDDLAHDH